MKITATRKEDILRRKAQYEADLAAYEADDEVRHRAYYSAQYALTDPIKNELQSHLAQFSTLIFDVDVDFRFGHHPRVRIQCNEHNKFDENVALSWSYDVELTDEGEIKRESSSWSGMKATTAAQIESLKQSVAALEYLLSVDWATLLNVDKPHFKDFYDGALKKPAYENFDAQLVDAELSELVGTNTLIKVSDWENTGRYGSRERYIQIERETPTQWVIHYLSAYGVDKAIEAGTPISDILNDPYNGFKYTTRVSKSKIVPVTPLTTIEY